MIKVFLVEDEVVIRQSIRKNINWEEEGLEFAGEARDGELAYPMIQQIKPDIIVTDIKMPFLDGLELSRLVKSEMPWIKIIILSGYDEFEFAREAISIGITDYLLKPIAGTRLLNAVLKVKKEIEEERLKQENIQRVLLEMEQNERLIRQQFFIDLVSKKTSTSQLILKGRNLHLDLSARRYNIVLLMIRTLGLEVTSYDELEKIKLDIITKFENLGGISFDRMDEGIAFLLKGNDANSILEVIHNGVEYIIENVKNDSVIEYFVGIGTSVERLSELSKSYAEACKAFAYRYIIERNKVVYSENLKDLHFMKDSDLDLNNINIRQINPGIIVTFLKSGNKSEVRTFLLEYFKSLGESNMKSLMFRQYIAMNIYFSGINLLEEWGYDSEMMKVKCGDMDGLLYELKKIEDMINYLETMLISVIEVRDMLSSKKYNIILEKAKKYMNENFSREDISMLAVANYLNISSCHFSTIFSQESGQTFTEYLTEIRMNKAKELLCCTNMKSSEIGYAVGYKDPHYFSYLFKKTQNYNPKEFRLRGKE